MEETERIKAIEELCSSVNDESDLWIPAFRKMFSPRTRKK
jgi:hypothetical protein